ncbi:MAG TPA: hypothetical protein VNU71_00950 [Burkholderiaceae bacterium]|nr:hypothetical protein [Burkholderiaceae bacterium]
MRRHAIARRAAGLSMIELMVGVTVALFIAAGAITMFAGQLREQRALLLEARLMQDLRSAADVVTRDLRRAGYWGAAADGVWAAGATGVSTNPYAALPPSGAASDAVALRYSRDASENNSVDSNEQFGFRLHNGAIELQLGAANWQTLTDATTLTIIAFSVTPTVRDISLDSFCPAPCPPASSACPPHQQIRDFAVEIIGRLVAAPAVERRVHGQVRVRNDAVSGACA